MEARPDWRIVSDCRDQLGESPQWIAATGELYWVDFYGPTIRRLGADGKRSNWTLKGFKNVGSIVPCSDGRLVAGMDNGLHLFDPRDGSTTSVADPNDGRPDIVYNDAKTDRHGNYWIGNCDAPETTPRGIFYVRLKDGTWRLGDSGFAVCNGPTFSPKGDILYFSDSMGRQNLAYDLDPTSGALGRRRVFQAYAEGEGFPDGMCTDQEGCIWVALYDGGKVLRLSPEGKRLQVFTLPVRNVTSCCLGGKDLKTLFVTTARAADGSDREGGAVFATEVLVAGIPEIPLDLSPSAIRGGAK